MGYDADVRMEEAAMTSQTADIQALTQQLERVERNLRWRKRFGGAIPTMLVAIMLLGAASGRAPDEIRARRFVLEDANGKERAVLRVWDDGRVGLQLRDQDANSRVMLDLGRDGSPGLSLFDKNGKDSAVLFITHDGGPRMIFNKDSKVIWGAP